MEEDSPVHPPGHSTGPKSPKGKSTSSMNALVHGCRAQTLILPDESQEHFDNLRALWLDEYQPDTPAMLRLVEDLILCDWFLQRMTRRYIAVEAKLAEIDYTEWNPDQHRQLQLILRYKTSAERSYSRAWRALEHARKEQAASKTKKEPQPAKAPPPPKTPLSPAQALFSGQNSKKNEREIPVLDQWVEVRIENGQTVTQLFPSNEELIEHGKTMDPPPELVYRRFHFIHGVPLEYHWVTTNASRRENGGGAIQRMTVDTWLEVIAREQAKGFGHLGPTGVGNLPRPKEHGECECEVCTHNQALLEANE